jgi:hypothetical protein
MSDMIFPWSIQEAESRGFRVKQQDGLTLITPSLDKDKWQDNPDDPYANDSELVWRSALLDEDMRPISLGFQKFSNYSEPGWEAIYRKIDKSISDGTALLTAKEDGTLIIRSVWNGKVIWRTRNSFDLGPFHDPVMELVAKNKYLSEPGFWVDCHMLFEYVSPANKIVIEYPKPKLILLAIREGHQLLPFEYSVEDCCVEFGITPIRILILDSDNPKDMQKEITELERQGIWDCEGVVVRTPEGLMSKIKGSEYLRIYRTRFFFKYDDFAKLCLENGVTDISEAKEIYLANGVDWEALPNVDNWFNTYMDRHGRISEDANWAQYAVKLWKMINPDSQRRDFAQWVKTTISDTTRQVFAFALYDDNPDKWKRIFEKARDKAIFAPVSSEFNKQFFSLQEEA